MRILLSLSLALFVSAPALADPQVTKPQQDDGDKVVCISENIVGSRISSRVCRTKREWDAARENDKRTLDRRNGEQRAPKPHGAG
jgi:hypothetical protein